MANRSRALLALLAAFTLAAPAFAVTDTFTGTAATALATHDANWTANPSQDGLTGMQLDGSGNLQQSGFNFADAFYNGAGTSSSSKSHIVINAGVTIDAAGNLTGVGIRMNTTQRGYQCFLKSSTNVNTNLDKVGCRCNAVFMADVPLSPTINANTTNVDMILEPNGASALQLTMNSTVYAIDLTDALIVANCTSTVITGGFPSLFIYHNSGTTSQLITSWTDDASSTTVVNPISGRGGAAARPLSFNRWPAANDDDFRLRATR